MTKPGGNVPDERAPEAHPQQRSEFAMITGRNRTQMETCLMKATELIGDIDEHHRLQARVPEQRALAFRQWTEAFPYKRSSPLPDDAISRASFYSPGRE